MIIRNSRGCLPLSDEGILMTFDVEPGNIRVMCIEQSGKTGGRYTFLMSMKFEPLTADQAFLDIDVLDLRNTDEETILSDRPVFETGRIGVDQSSKSQWRTVYFNKTYNNPIVIMGTPSFNGSDPMVMGVRNVTNTNFQYQLDEWNYLNGSHTTENFGYLVMEQGEYRVDDVAMVAGVIEGVDHEWRTGRINVRAFDGTQTVTTNGSAAVTTRIKNIADRSFEVKVQEEEALYSIHNHETIHFLAIEKKAGIREVEGKSFFSYQCDTMSHAWDYISIAGIPDPLVFGQIITYEGNNPAALRHEVFNSITVSMKIEEEQSRDSEMDHAIETVGYLFFEE